jgi:hypothetical protein
MLRVDPLRALAVARVGVVGPKRARSGASFPSLQAAGRRHAGPVPHVRKKPLRSIQGDTLQFLTPNFREEYEEYGEYERPVDSTLPVVRVVRIGAVPVRPADSRDGRADLWPRHVQPDGLPLGRASAGHHSEAAGLDDALPVGAAIGELLWPHRERHRAPVESDSAPRPIRSDRRNPFAWSWPRPGG